jgi:hypothetical protein
LPHLPNIDHHGGDDINVYDKAHRILDLINACRGFVDYIDPIHGDDPEHLNDAATVVLATDLHTAAANVLDVLSPGYTVDLGPVDQLAAPINPDTLRINIDGRAYRLTPARDEVT